MTSTGDSVSNDAETSYTALPDMASADTQDPFQAGRHCAFCNQLDFLPFRCESCKSQFCLDHRTEISHNCPKKGEWAQNRREQAGLSSSTIAPKKPNILTHETQCSHPQCKTLIDTPLVQGISCPHCNRRYCLKHRMKEQHDCDKLPPIGAKSGKGDRGLGDALNKLRAWGAHKKATIASSSSSSSSSPFVKTSTSTADGAGDSAKVSNNSSSTGSATLQRIISPFTSSRKSAVASSVVAVNKLKGTAKGDAKVPAERRLYLRLEAVREGEGTSGAKFPRADAFYDREWKVGRALDAMAKTLAIENINNREITEQQRLRIFWIEGGRLLEFSEKLTEVKAGSTMLKSGDTLVLLRGVGPLDN